MVPVAPSNFQQTARQNFPLLQRRTTLVALSRLWIVTPGSIKRCLVMVMVTIDGDGDGDGDGDDDDDDDDDDDEDDDD